MGRPRKPIDGNMVFRLAGIGCTDQEIGTLVGCSHDTLTRRFAYRLRKGRAKLRMSLRRKQVETALSGGKGAVSMQIWLGKQLLGQTDKQEVKHEGLAALYTDPREKHGSTAVATPSNS